MTINFPKLIFSIGICLGVGIIGSFFTISAIPTWYVTLNKPTFSPPNWVFGPVWTTLYVLMGVALYIVQSAKLKVKSDKVEALNIFWIQLILNAAWSILFFGMKNPALAMVDIMALWITILLTIKVFYKISKLAGYLLIPYFLWVSFASLLNLFIVLLN